MSSATEDAAVAALVARYGLTPHPEGGYFKETYRAPTSFARDGDGAKRSLATSIFYLLRRGQKSSLHRIKSDELWFHHAGDDLSVYELLDPGQAAGAGAGASPAAASVRRTLMGSTSPAAVHFYAVGAGVYFGSILDEPAGAHGFSLVSCVVAPGFDFADWTMEGKEKLLQLFPGDECARVIAFLGAEGV